MYIARIVCSTFPFISRAASFASLGLSNVTKAKPLDLFVSRSFINRTGNESKFSHSKITTIHRDKTENAQELLKILLNKRLKLESKCFHHTFSNSSIFAKELLQGLFGSFGVQATNEELPWSVCLCHAKTKITTSQTAIKGLFLC